MYLPENLVNEWNQAYIKNNDKTEIAFCLRGTGTVINESRPAIIRHSEWDGVGIQCKMSDIADLHTHPNHDCRMSYTDIIESQRDSTFATGLICDVNKYVFWKNGSFLKIFISNNRDEYTDISFKTILAE
jgi:hypothetical protein